jgi:hypothetical protein
MPIVLAIRLGGGWLGNEHLISPSLAWGIDYATILVGAGIVAKRFRDFGWPGWVGVIALVGTGVLPLVCYIYLYGGIRQHGRDAVVDSWAGIVSGALLLALLFAAGLPRTRRRDPDRFIPLPQRIEPHF